MRKAICMIVVGAIAVGLFAVGAGSQSKTASGFDRLKTLVGEWQGTSPKGEVFTSTIRPVSNGTALEETFQNSEDNQMVTLYTPDGDRLLITHYCSTGNQPRMQTVPVKAGQKEFAFSFTGVSNLKSPAAPRHAIIGADDPILLHAQHLLDRPAHIGHEGRTWLGCGHCEASVVIRHEALREVPIGSRQGLDLGQP